MKTICLVVLSFALVLMSPALAEANGQKFGGHGYGNHSFGRGAGLHRSFHGARSFHKHKIYRHNPSRASRHFKKSRFKGAAFPRPHHPRKHGHAPSYKHPKRRKFRSKHIVIYPGYYWGRGRDVIVTQINTTDTRRGDEDTERADRPVPFQAKLIRIGEGDTVLDSEALAQLPDPDKSGKAGDCLSVKKEILVGEETLDAFGKACLQPDGTWRLVPTEE